MGEKINMIDIIIDTNAIIYFIKGLPQGKFLKDLLGQNRIKFGISTVTETELLAKPNLTDEEKIIIEECLSYFSIIEINSHIARIAALYRRQKLALGDAYIAATAKYLDVPLWTYNINDFKKINNIVVSLPKKE